MLLFVFITLYLLLVLLRPQDYPQFAGVGIPILPLALMAAAGAWVLSREKRFDAPQYLLLVLFYLSTCVSLLVFGWFGGAQAQFTDFLPTVISFVLLANAVNTPSRTKTIMALFVLCACVMALHGIDQSLDGVGWTGQETVMDGRIQYVGIFSDPNDLGMLFVLSMPMALYLGTRGGLLGFRRLWWFAACALLFYGIYLTNSRGALLSVVTMTAAYLWIRKGPMVGGLLAAAALAMLKLMPSRLDQLDVSEQSASGRVDAWYEGMQMFIWQPLFGVGTGRFTDYHHLTAHNSIILVLAENGIVGFLFWFVFVGYCFWMMGRIIRHEPELVDGADADDWSEARAKAIALLVALTGFFTAAFFLSRSYVILLYLLAALVVAHFSNVRERFPSLEEMRLSSHIVRWAILTPLAVVAFYLILKLLLAMG
ncbi:O-antigen polymerase [Luteimonas aestuarii]|uniref:O-antigen polymerase n=1 Tax=Luteimonas aestuarii TaxID=453837 RepID=A0A4R5U4D4_9GAMM|nr:O-antigen ligase family protein [Luteimonas aestuarii]TDK28504.1 O-antigen polymerase [Luteimonas aestuarii]